MIVDNFDILFYNLNEAREFQILRLLFYYFGFKTPVGGREICILLRCVNAANTRGLEREKCTSMC